MRLPEHFCHVAAFGHAFLPQQDQRWRAHVFGQPGCPAQPLTCQTFKTHRFAPHLKRNMAKRLLSGKYRTQIETTWRCSPTSCAALVV